MALADLPVWWANAITVVIFAGIIVGVLLVPKDAVLREAPDNARWRDFRYWAVGLSLVQLVIYYLFA